ncbi:flagellar motor protein [Marinobacterium jannaschii]|uniref:flagellar motor protein n=1 Tax=Marinobacterium jannaschii TaxID=64970 RepID=UPI00047FA5B1|nr:flagellar motor protein [Marinobacterium jannaschii]
MDLLTLLGMALAGLALFGGNYLEGGQAAQLVNLPALVIVLGGTLAAATVQSPRGELGRAFRLIGWAFSSNRPDFNKGISNITEWSSRVRRNGLLELEPVMEREKDDFIRSGLQLLIDGRTADVLRTNLSVELISQEQSDLKGARVLESMGGYAPTMGIIGAVLGLIHVMNSLDDPSALGAGIATAFVATIYGVGIANLLLIPLANKIKTLVLMRYHYHEMMLEGMMAIAQGQNTRNIEQRLRGFVK